MKRTAWGIAAILAVMLLAGIGRLLWWIFTADSFEWWSAQRVPVGVTGGVLKFDAHGEVVLPARYASASVTGRAYVNHGRKGLIMIFFPTAYGHFNTEGYLYCSRPLTPTDTSGRSPAGGHEEIKLRYDLYPFPPPSRGSASPTHEVELIQKISPHWYEIYEPED